MIKEKYGVDNSSKGNSKNNNDDDDELDYKDELWILYLFYIYENNNNSINRWE